MVELIPITKCFGTLKHKYTVKFKENEILKILKYLLYLVSKK